ncbi:MAG: DUF11 domain-containing protein, partial [Actinobacteria bacterium]|nr:DUF11 domain-containing protein [Actinomycetota bacterium]
MGGWTRLGRWASCVALVGAAILSCTDLFSPTASYAAQQSITSSTGPLTNITATDVLNCAVNHISDSAGEFFAGTSCGTFVSDGTTLFGPGLVGETVWTPVSQTGVSGSGTPSDPFSITTVVQGGSSLRVTQTDSYVEGQESYRTDITVTNLLGNAVNAQIYRAADCYLQSSDSGFGYADPVVGSVACQGATTDASGNTVPSSRLEQWYPLTGGSNYYESGYSSVWSQVASQTSFPNTCDCATYQDNGAGLNWSVTINAGGSVTESHRTTFSPAGIQPLVTSKTADAASAAPGATDGYTITIHNPNGGAESLSSVLDTLPPGFTYLPGTTSGALTADPAVGGQQLTWTFPSPVLVPAGGDLTLHFQVSVSTVAGTWTNSASATSPDVPVSGTGATAPVTVGGAAP